MSQAGQFYQDGLLSTLTGDIGGVITPVAGNIDILGGTGIVITGTPGTLTIDFTLPVAVSFPTDAGIADPIAGELDIVGGANINTTGAGNVVTVILNDNVTLSGQLEANEIESLTYITAVGDISSVTGDISTVAGDITSGGVLTVVGDITTTTGDFRAAAGDVNVGGVVLAVGDITSSAGDVIAQNDVTATTGDIISSTGAGIFATTVTAGTDITSTAGNIEASAGNVTASGTITAGSGLIAVTGGVLASAGDITATLGDIVTSAGSIDSASTVSAVGDITTSTGDIVSTLGLGSFATSVTAGGDITSTAGNIAASAGTITASGNISSTAGNIVTIIGSLDSGSTVSAVDDITTSTGDIVSTLGDLRAPNGTLYVATFSSTGDIITTGGDLIATVGDVSAGNLVVAANGITSTTGNITATVGDIVATAGSITAESNIATVNGSINAPNGDITAGYDLVAGADISSIMGDVTAEQGDVLARYDIEAVEGNITAHAGDIQTISGNILAGADIIALGNIDVTGTMRFRSYTNGPLGADSDGFITIISTGFATFTGFDSWDGAGPYYDDTTLGEFDIVQSGTGYINSTEVTWTAPQTVTGLTAGNTYYIYIDSNGDIGKTTTLSQSLYEDYIVLFECLRDSTGTNVQYTVKENHPAVFPPATHYYLNSIVGSVIENGGADIALNGTQKVQIDGADVLGDEGLYTTISDSGAAAVTFNQMYTTGAGKWATYQSSDTFAGYWNSAGTPTAPTGTKFSIYRLYVSKDDLNAATPTYWAVLDDQEYADLPAAQVAVTDGSPASVTNELASLELAQLGYIIYNQSTSTIVDVIVEKSTIGTTVGSSGSGGGGDASLVSTDTSNFDGILSAADTTVQAALETVDEWGKTTTDHAVLLGQGVGNPIASTSVGTNGQVIVGSAGADPDFANITSTDSSITITEGAGTLALTGTQSTTAQLGSVELATDAEAIDGTDSDRPVVPSSLAAKLGTQTDHGVLVGSGATAAITSLAAATDGQLIIGSTGADPVVASLTSGDSSVTITPGAGTLDIVVTATSPMVWSEVTDATLAMSVNNGYILNRGTLVTATIPTTATVGSRIRVAGMGAGGWRISQNASEEIRFGTATTTNGVTGYLASTDDNDCVELICIVADTTWLVLSSIGNITVA